MFIIRILSLIVLISYTHSYPLQFDYNAPADIYEKSIRKPNSKGYAKDLNVFSKWTEGLVPYTIDASYSAQQVSVIKAGMKLIEDSTRINGKDCIKFTQRTTETTYLRIFSDSGCWSYIGKVFTGAQPLSLKIPTPASRGSCIFTGTVAHELMHALGFDHEQTRPDRDNYVTINWAKIQSGVESNFQIRQDGKDLGFSYDYDSILHYESDAFSIDGSPTIVPLKSGVQLINKFNQTYLTSTDIGEIRKFYDCNMAKDKFDILAIFTMSIFCFFIQAIFFQKFN